MSAAASPRPDADPPGTPPEARSTPRLDPTGRHLEAPFPNRQYISSDCLKRLDAFRYRPRSLASAAAPEIEAGGRAGQTMNNAAGDVQIRDWPAGDNEQEYESALGEEEEGEEEGCVLTDYGSTSMFDDEPWFPDDEGDHTQSEAAGWPTPRGSSGLRVDGVHELQSDVDFSFLDQQGLSDLVYPLVDAASTPVHPGVGWQHPIGLGGNKFKPLAQFPDDFPSDLTSPGKQYPPDFERNKKGQLLVPHFEEGSPDGTYLIQGSILEASNGKQSAVTGVGGGRPRVVRCRASDVSRNGKVRSINVSGLSCSANYNSGWPLSNKAMEPIQRPEFPAIVKQRPLIYGLSGKLTVKTCFRIGEALQVGSLVVGGNLQGDVLIELYAKVLSSRRIPGETRQEFQFGDIFRSGPPFLSGEYRLFKTCELWETDSKVFEGEAGKGKMARAVGHLTRSAKGVNWILQIQSIWEAGWDDIGLVKAIICGEGAGCKKY